MPTNKVKLHKCIIICTLNLFPLPLNCPFIIPEPLLPCPELLRMHEVPSIPHQRIHINMQHFMVYDKLYEITRYMLSVEDRIYPYDICMPAVAPQGSLPCRVSSPARTPGYRTQDSFPKVLSVQVPIYIIEVMVFPLRVDFYSLGW